MSTAQSLIAISAAMTLTTAAWAGGSGRSSISVDNSSENPWTSLAWPVHYRQDDRHRARRTVSAPLVFLARAWGTFLNSPRILSEGIEGDRALVNRRGILAPREIPPEERIYTADD